MDVASRALSVKRGPSPEGGVVRPKPPKGRYWGDCSLEKLYMKGIDGLPLPAARQPGPE
jgi:hypothetical protein